MLRTIIELLDILFFVEIIQNFLTSYTDTETFAPVYSVKKIAVDYIMNRSFFVHLLAALPYQLFTRGDSDPQENVLRNLLMLKMLRIKRLSTDLLPDDVLLQLMQVLYKAESRDEKIAKERFINNLIKIIKQIMTTLVTTYFLALLWYRFSDYLQQFLGFGESEEDYFVVVFNLRPPTYFAETSRWIFNSTDSIGKPLDGVQRMLYEGDEWNMPESGSHAQENHVRLTTIMYYALTTLSTVGYGDFSPVSIAEKIVGAVIQIFGVTFFSVLMNSFIDVVQGMRN